MADRDSVPVLGIDVGGVIVTRADGDADTSFFGDRPMETPPVEGAFEALGALTQLFDGRVYVISKAKQKTAATTRAWFEHVSFYSLTGISPGNVHFVLERPHKAPLCAKYGVTHFVDDRLDVLASLDCVPHRYLFTGGLGGHAMPSDVPSDVEVVDGWLALEATIGRSLKSPQAG
jgi:hypothetical protein